MQTEWLYLITDIHEGRTLRLWLGPQTSPAQLGIRWLMDPDTRRILDPALTAGELGLPFGARLLAFVE